MNRVISLEIQTCPKGTIRLLVLLCVCRCPVELYHCFEFLSDETPCLWGISSLQLIKSTSAGNRNTSPATVAVKIFACPKSQSEKCESLLMLPSSSASVTQICLEEMLPDMNALQPTSSTRLAETIAKHFTCSPLTDSFLILIGKASPIKSHSFLCLPALAV